MRTSFPFVALTVLAFGMAWSQATEQNTAFTYQGQVTQNGSAANGLYEMQFTLYDAVTNGSVVSTPVNLAPVRVTNGLFTVPLDFGAGAFLGADRWLEITITVFNSDQPPVTLRPRQPITPAPYALHAANAANLMSFANAPLEIKVNGQRALRLEGNGSNAANLIGGHPHNGVAPGVIGAVIAGGGSLDAADGDQPNRVEANFGTVSGGYGNVVNARLASIGGGRENTVQGAFASVIGGGYRNLIEIEAQRSTIGGGTGNRISVGAFYSTISGGEDNIIHSNAPGSTINGGTEQEIGFGSGYSLIGGGVENIIAARSPVATIVGGLENQILSDATGGVIGGGFYNMIGTNAASANIGGGKINQVWSSHATIGGGRGNRIEADATESIIGGGGNNRVEAGAHSATVGGGWGNTIRSNAFLATIPGGDGNIAAGPHSFAAGRAAQAFHRGSFVWADSFTGLSEIPIPFSSTGTNEFSARATGGVRLVSGVDGTGAPSAGVSLAPGSGTWSSLSDRNAKENFRAADAREILEKVAALPLASWNYKAQGGGVRHLGPTAQDFHTAFGIGENDCTITTVDADGVALAAIQGLNQKLEQTVKDQAAEIRALQRSLSELKELVSRLGEPPKGGVR